MAYLLLFNSMRFLVSFVFGKRTNGIMAGFEVLMTGTFAPFQLS